MHLLSNLSVSSINFPNPARTPNYMPKRNAHLSNQLKILPIIIQKFPVEISFKILINNRVFLASTLVHYRYLFRFGDAHYPPVLFYDPKHLVIDSHAWVTCPYIMANSIFSMFQNIKNVTFGRGSSDISGSILGQFIVRNVKTLMSIKINNQINKSIYTSDNDNVFCSDYSDIDSICIPSKVNEVITCNVDYIEVNGTDSLRWMKLLNTVIFKKVKTLIINMSFIKPSISEDTVCVIQRDIKQFLNNIVYTEDFHFRMTALDEVNKSILYTILYNMLNKKYLNSIHLHGCRGLRQIFIQIVDIFESHILKQNIRPLLRYMSEDKSNTLNTLYYSERNDTLPKSNVRQIICPQLNDIYVYGICGLFEEFILIHYLLDKKCTLHIEEIFDMLENPLVYRVLPIISENIKKLSLTINIKLNSRISDELSAFNTKSTKVSRIGKNKKQTLPIGSIRILPKSKFKFLETLKLINLNPYNQTHVDCLNKCEFDFDRKKLSFEILFNPSILHDEYIKNIKIIDSLEKLYKIVKPTKLSVSPVMSAELINILNNRFMYRHIKIYQSGSRKRNDWLLSWTCEDIYTENNKQKKIASEFTLIDSKSIQWLLYVMSQSNNWKKKKQQVCSMFGLNHNIELSGLSDLPPMITQELDPIVICPDIEHINIIFRYTDMLEQCLNSYKKDVYTRSNIFNITFCHTIISDLLEECVYTLKSAYVIYILSKEMSSIIQNMEETYDNSAVMVLIDDFQDMFLNALSVRDIESKFELTVNLKSYICNILKENDIRLNIGQKYIEVVITRI